MQLKVLRFGIWKVVAPVNGDGRCEVEDQLVELLADPKLKGYAVGFFALWERIPQFGPRQLPTALYHSVDEAHGIYEFIKGPLRLLCFEADGALVVCSHVIRKRSQKIRKQDKAPAIALREAFLSARAADNVQWMKEADGEI